MQIEIQLTTDAIPLAPAEVPRQLDGAVGAVVEFRGIVRGNEHGEPISAIEYEAYQPMAGHLIRAALEEMSASHPCLAVRVRHRLGMVQVGECAFHMVVMARHRGEALALLEKFIERLKQDVPVWKRPVPVLHAHGSSAAS